MQSSNTPGVDNQAGGTAAFGQAFKDDVGIYDNTRQGSIGHSTIIAPFLMSEKSVWDWACSHVKSSPIFSAKSSFDRIGATVALRSGRIARLVVSVAELSSRWVTDLAIRRERNLTVAHLPLRALRPLDKLGTSQAQDELRRSLPLAMASNGGDCFVAPLLAMTCNAEYAIVRVSVTLIKPIPPSSPF